MENNIAYEEFYNQRSKRKSWPGHVARMGEMRNEYKDLWEKLKIRELRRYRHRWANNIKTYFNEIEYEDMDWIQLAQDRDK
jgi:hypothetical protein